MLFRSYSNPSTAFAADTAFPANPVGAWLGHALVPTPLVLLPAYSRCRVQMTIPNYRNANNSTWPFNVPWLGNTWTMHAEIMEPTR